MFQGGDVSGVAQMTQGWARRERGSWTGQWQDGLANMMFVGRTNRMFGVFANT